jgi:hypothetical protein
MLTYAQNYFIQAYRKGTLSKLFCHKDKIFKNEIRWNNFLKRQKIKTEHHSRIVTEGSLIGSITYHGFNPELAIISDDAGQFDIFVHGLCWVHAERTIQKLVGYNARHNHLLENAKTDIWNLYRALKKYRCNPSESQKLKLETRFNSIFTHKTGFASLDLALKRIYQNKSELLLVLNRPEVPLHNNLSERDIREYVKKRVTVQRIQTL